MTTATRAIRRPRVITGIDYILGHPARPRNEGGPHADLHLPRQLQRSGDPEHQGQPQAPRRRQEDAEGHGRRGEAVLSDDGRPRHRHGHGGPERRDGREVHSHALRGRQRPHDDDEGVHRGGVPEADLDASVTLPEYRVKARNTAESPENKIHDDAVARQYGFRGGLVPGVTVYAYLTLPLVAAFGAAWLERGTAAVRFVEPVLDGEELTVAGTVVGRDAKGVTATLVASTAAAGECATLTATLPAGSPVPVNLALDPTAPLPAERPAATRPHLDGLAALGTPVTTYDDARAGEYLEKVGDALGLYRGARGFVHPGFFLDQGNRALDKNVTLSPWIHVGSVVRHLSGARVGETLATRGRVRSLFDKKGREFVELDLVIVTGERPRPVAHILHTAVYQLGGPDMAPQTPQVGAPAKPDAPAHPQVAAPAKPDAPAPPQVAPPAKP